MIQDGVWHLRRAQLATWKLHEWCFALAFVHRIQKMVRWQTTTARDCLEASRTSLPALDDAAALAALVPLGLTPQHAQALREMNQIEVKTTPSPQSSCLRAWGWIGSMHWPI